MAEQLHEIVYGRHGNAERLVPRWNWFRCDNRVYLGQATEVNPTDITDKLTGTTPKFAISEDD